LHSDNHGSIKSLTKSVRSVDPCCRTRVADERVERVGHEHCQPDGARARPHARFFAKSEAGELSDFFSAQVTASKNKRRCLRALHSIYIALAAFACATLVTLLGAELISVAGALSLRAVASLGIALGFVGVGGLVVACVNLFRATHISVLNIRDEAATIRTRKARGSIERKS